LKLPIAAVKSLHFKRTFPYQLSFFDDSKFCPKIRRKQATITSNQNAWFPLMLIYPRLFKSPLTKNFTNVFARHLQQQVASPIKFTSPVSIFTMKTIIKKVDPLQIGQIDAPDKHFWIQDWGLTLDDSESCRNLLDGARRLREDTVPIAFPTETVYGLGADATRSEAVKAIFTAKQRPADNPLIVHFASVKQLTDLSGPIPEIYDSLIRKFWPGPLTILLPLPSKSSLAPEVTAGLSTFGARIPASPVALALIKLANVPIAGPSANASTRPSPTGAEHVAHDLDGRIELILDGGPCEVGVESTVVDGLATPPVILRPGGIGIEQLRSCPGWENVQLAYEDKAQKGGDAPRAPGMKYRHYSPKATVILHEEGSSPPSFMDAAKASEWSAVGFVRTKAWRTHGIFSDSQLSEPPIAESVQPSQRTTTGTFTSSLFAAVSKPIPAVKSLTIHDTATGAQLPAFVVDLGSDSKDVARGLFSALRDLDVKGVKAIFVEGIGESEGDLAAAVLNRLRKAAEVNVMGSG
jgi:L-threonylcarbamoyladenylate synthase